ncbi:MAG TPA: thioesterase family protein [Marmoricola sp.]|nr:thioesterase family protein [Marmoricola sp.]
MDHELDRAIALTRREDGRFAADLDAGWLIGDALNGGYLLAVIGNAARATLVESGQPDPLAVSAHYLSAARPGPAEVRVRLVRGGRRHSTVAVSLLQQEDGEDVERITALATYGDLSRNPDDVRTTAAEPDLPPVEACISALPDDEELRRLVPLMERLGTRLEPASAGWAVGEPSHRGVIQGWFKLADDRPLDPLALLLALDAMPPTVADLGYSGWAPTLELTAHVRALPAPGWAKVRCATRNVADGYFEEDCEVWDSRGRLVAQSRQLALLPR